jgi:hypothetical protein
MKMKILNFIVDEMNIVFDCDIECSDVVVLNSSRKNKLLSYQFIVRKLYFADIAEHNEFGKYLVERFKTPRDDKEKLMFDSMRDMDGKIIFDSCVHSTDRLFRFIGQSKYGIDHVLKMEGKQYECHHSFVRLYTHAEVEEKKRIYVPIKYKVACEDRVRSVVNVGDQNFHDVLKIAEFAALISDEYVGKGSYQHWLKIVWSLRKMGDNYYDIAKSFSKARADRKGFADVWSGRIRCNSNDVGEGTFFHYCKMSDEKVFKALCSKYGRIDWREESAKPIDTLLQ